ncbi:histidine phosphotransferase family protein [Paramylibacter ulvae]|nr:histidine phosphotransferase family protein [Amylibacter ulvae]
MVSPVGAIRNGLELLEMSGVKPSLELDLINQSAQNANARLSYLRVAFGDAGGSSKFSQQEITAIIGAYFENKRVRVNWQVTTDQPRSVVKTLLLLIMCFETGLPYGGEILVRTADSTWAITGSDDRTAFDTPHWDAMITGQDFELSSATVHFELARAAMSLNDINPEWGKTSGALRMQFQTNAA